MTANYRIRKNKNPIRVNSMFFSRFNIGHDFHMPCLSRKEVRNLRHGNVVYRGIIGPAGISISEYRVMDRSKPHVAFSHKCEKIKKDRMRIIDTTYVLHARERGARRDMESIDYPMTAKQKLRLARQGHHPVDQMCIPVVSTGSWYISRDDTSRFALRSAKQSELSPNHLDTVTKDRDRIVTSMKEFNRVMDSEGSVGSWIGLDLYYENDLRSGGFLVRTKREALRLARAFLGSSQGNIALRSMEEEDKWEREMEREFDEDSTDRYDSYDDDDTLDQENSDSSDESDEANDDTFSLDIPHPEPEEGMSCKHHMTDQQLREFGIEE